MYRVMQGKGGNLRILKGAALSVRDLAGKYPGVLRPMKTRDGTVFWQLSADLRVDCGARLYLDPAPIIARKGFHIDACSQSLQSLDGAKVKQKLITPLDPQGSLVKHEWLSDLVCVANLPGTNGHRVITGVTQDGFIPNDFFGMIVWDPVFWHPEEWFNGDIDPDDILERGQLVMGRVCAHLRANKIMTLSSPWNPWRWQFGDDPGNYDPTDFDNPTADPDATSVRGYRNQFKATLCAIKQYGLRPLLSFNSAPPSMHYPWTRYHRSKNCHWLPKGRCPDDVNEERQLRPLSRFCQGGPRRYWRESYSSQDTYADVPEDCKHPTDCAFNRRICSDEFDCLARTIVEMVDEAIRIVGPDVEIDVSFGGEFEISCVAGTSGWDADVYDLAILTRVIWRALHCDPNNPRNNVRYVGPSSATGRQFFRNDPDDVLEQGRGDYCTWMTKLFCYSNEVLPSGRSRYDPPQGQEIPRRIYFDAISMNAYYRDSDPTVPAPRAYNNDPRYANDHCWRAAWLNDPNDRSDQQPSCSGPRSGIEGMYMLIQLISQYGNWPGGAALPMYITEQGNGHVDEFGDRGHPVWGYARGFANQNPAIWEPLQAVFEVTRQAEFLAAGLPLRGMTNFLYACDLRAGGDFDYCTKNRYCDPGPPDHTSGWFDPQKNPFDYKTLEEYSCEGYRDRIRDIYEIPAGGCRPAKIDETAQERARRLWECYELPSFKALSVQAKLLIGKRFSAAEQRRLLCDHLGSNPLGTSLDFEDERRGTRWIWEQQAGTLRPYAHSFCLQSSDDENIGKGIYVHQINRRGWRREDSDDLTVSYLTRNALQADVHHIDRRIEAHDLIPQIRDSRLRFCAADLPLAVNEDTVEEDDTGQVWCWAPDVIWVEELPNPVILMGGVLYSHPDPLLVCLVYCPTGADTLESVGSLPSFTLRFFPENPNLAMSVDTAPSFTYGLRAHSIVRGRSFMSDTFPCLRVAEGDPWFQGQVLAPTLPGASGSTQSKSATESHTLRQYLARFFKSFADGGLTGFLAGFANTNLRTYDAKMLLRIWAVGIRLLSDQVNIYVNTGSGLQGPLASFELVPTTEGISVGIFEVDLVGAGLGGLAAGSYTIYLEVGGALWWPWNPY